MTDEYPREWQEITKDGQLKRLKVPGGWIVWNRTMLVDRDKFVVHSESMVFVPDDNHTWILEDK